MSSFSFLVDQPFSMNQVRKVVEEGGGGSVMRAGAPEVVGVAGEALRPKCQLHTRFTITRAVSGILLVW